MLTFDPENRMTAYGSVMTAGYNGDGLRAWKQTSSGRTYFLYDGVVPVVELDAAGLIISTNTFGAAGLISRRSDGRSAFYTFDSEGNVSQRLDDRGDALSTHLFNAHGEVLGDSLNDPFGYKGQFGYYSDNETGLQLLTHRYYDPSRGRFLTRDPISYGGGINLYSYVANNAINSIDPFGLTRLKFYISTGTLVVITNEGYRYYIRATSGKGDATNDPRRTRGSIHRIDTGGSVLH
ncbi:MAG TPA: RHS repeat-associated core domain-containing protein [Pyrinomonadaceae bacterium]|nr:RHS repeat-associated core domain-containing protein [Pyrinomonadaceae bacterium]